MILEKNTLYITKEYWNSTAFIITYMQHLISPFALTSYDKIALHTSYINMLQLHTSYLVLHFYLMIYLSLLWSKLL